MTIGYAIITTNGGIRLEGEQPFLGNEVDDVLQYVKQSIDLSIVESSMHIGYVKIDSSEHPPINVSLFDDVVREYGVTNIA